MYYLKILFCIFLLTLTSCSSNIQKNGISDVTFNKINVNIGKTTKKDLISKYGSPFFESVFNKNVIYYVSHTTSYKILEKFKTKKLLVYEITFNDKKIVSNLKKYSEKDAYNIPVSDKANKNDRDSIFILKEFLNNMTRNNIQN